ncbi:MAG TPA: glycosyltransferase family 4 protein [Ktedonosporobacter sp.]|nr:glycosyltransferase family 4 protein [Ktedonosporobacter sp.]
MAHILFVTPYYPPEVGAAQVRISETARRLVRRGHHVTVLTTYPNYPSGKVPPEYHKRKIYRETADGVEIIRVWSYISPNKGFLRRILSQLSFGCLSPFIGLRALSRPDILIVESPPLFDAFAGRFLAWRYRCPFIFTVADLWPEAAVQMGVLRNRFLIRLTEWLESSTYQRAATIWTVTAGLYEILLKRGLPAEKLFLLTNGTDIDKFKPTSMAQARAELGWEDTFTLLHLGTIGLAQGLQTLLDAADLLRDQRDIRIVFVGEGATKADLEADATRRGLTNVTFRPSQPHERIPLIVSAADVCFASVRKLPLFENTVPTKTYESMACARPVLLAVDGVARKILVEEAGAALYVEPENAQALADAIVYLRDHPEEAAQLGARGREYVAVHFNRDLLVEKLDHRITTLLEQKHSSPAVEAASTSPQGSIDGLSH